ncbi:unnamed protein product, partial [Ectocarpus sp. 8 AP-2014]
ATQTAVKKSRHNICLVFSALAVSSLSPDITRTRTRTRTPTLLACRQFCLIPSLPTSTAICAVRCYARLYVSRCTRLIVCLDPGTNYRFPLVLIGPLPTSARGEHCACSGKR